MRPLPQPIEGIVSSVIKKMGLETRFKETQILKLWKDWVGALVARHALPYRVVNKKLVVYVDNSTWLEELNRYYKTWILKRIQTALGKGIVEEMIFKIGEKPEEKNDKKGKVK